MKTKFIALSLLTFFTFGCGGGGEKAAPSSSQSEEQAQSAQSTPEKETTPSQKKEPVMSLSYDMTSVEPEFVNAYIDASASMKGYFSKNSDGRFITAISNSGADKLFWLDRNYTEIKGIPTNQLLTGAFRGGDSQFHEMLENVITHDNLGISNGVSLLFTDGIISASSSQTKQNPEFTLQSKIIFQNEITKSIKKTKGIAVAIFMLKSKYNGAYYDYSNKPKSIDIAERPFYIIAIGKPANILHYVKNNKLGAALSETFGIYTKTVANGKGTIFKETTPKNWNKDKFIGNNLELTLTLPEYVAEMGKDYILSNITVDFNGMDVTEKVKKAEEAISVNGQTLRIQNWSTNDTKLPIIRSGVNTLKIEIKKDKEQGWEALYSENDKDIATNFLEQGKTFLLKYLIEGIKLGVETEETTIFMSKKEFTRKSK